MLLVQNLVRNAKLYPDRIATICGDRQHTWKQLADRVARAAAGLQTLGIAKGDRVGIMALNSDRYLEALFATMWAGAVMVPKNIRWSLEENIYAAEDSGIKVLVSDDAFAAAARGVAERLGSDVLTVIHADDNASSDAANWDELVANNDPIAPANNGYDELAGIYYTGGTTGFPKGVMLSHTALWTSAATTAVDIDLEPDIRYLHAAPMFHLADTALSNTTTIIGGTHVFIPSFSGAGTLAAIEEHSITFALLVPVMLAMTLNDPAFATTDVSSLTGLLYGASPMPEPVLRQGLEALPGVRFIQGYGQTEMAPLVTLLSHEYHALEGPKSKLRSAGRPISCVSVRIVDEDGRDCAVGETGEIWARGPNAMMGYWNKPEQTADTLIDGWVKTGDLAYEDEDGFIFICDRAKDMIITGGENVFSAEVESAVLSHPKVGEVAVIGIPDDTYGERVHAVIVPAPDAGEITQEEIYAHCHERIAGYKCPRSIALQEEPLPLSGAGKVLKKDLRAPYWEGSEKGVN